MGGGATLWLNILAEVLLLFFLSFWILSTTPPPLSLSLHLAFELEHFLDPNLNNHPEFS